MAPMSARNCETRARRRRSGGRRTAPAASPAAARPCPCAPTASPGPRRSTRIADSPGLRIGVPVSTPKTPTLVIVIVPPDMSAGEVFPSRAVAVRSPSAPASSAQRHPAGVLDVRHDQPARRGRGDAEVHVVLDHDLLGRLVPAAVDHRVPAGGEQQRLGHEQQRGDLDVGQLRPGGEALTQLHRPGHVDGEELGDVRRGERAGHHRRGGQLADALDRDPLLHRPASRRHRKPARRRRWRLPRARRASTSARVMTPPVPVPVRCVRSTPRSLANLRTGGLASSRGRRCPCADTCGGGRRVAGAARAASACRPTSSPPWRTRLGVGVGRGGEQRRVGLAARAVVGAGQPVDRAPSPGRPPASPARRGRRRASVVRGP